MTTALVTTRLLVRDAARSLDSAAPDHVARCAMAKYYATENASKVS